jgi:hypothetical protein
MSARLLGANKTDFASAKCEWRLSVAADGRENCTELRRRTNDKRLDSGVDTKRAKLPDRSLGKWVTWWGGFSNDERRCKIRDTFVDSTRSSCEAPNAVQPQFGWNYTHGEGAPVSKCRDDVARSASSSQRLQVSSVDIRQYLRITTWQSAH